MSREQYIEPDNSFYRPSRDPNEGTVKLVILMTVLFVALTTVLAVVYARKDKNDTDPTDIATNVSSYISVAPPTATPVPPLMDNQNALLYPGTAAVDITGEPKAVPEADPKARDITETITVDKNIITEYKAGDADKIDFRDPLEYGSNPGIATFRGNNFRNSAAFGYTPVKTGNIIKEWEYKGIGSLLASTMNFEWRGLKWTGQPLAVKWPKDVKTNMDMYDEAKNNDNLVEIICAALDGKIHFMDLVTGKATRDPINVGTSIKGTPALDPRGWPIIYVGQCDNNGNTGKFGMYIYSLIDGSLIYSYDGSEDGAYRSNWNAFDSSPVISAETDTLIWPCENGIIYKFKLNTGYKAGDKQITMQPSVTGYKYIFNDTTGTHLGVESSIAVYGNLGYFVDNTRDLCCIDLNTMKMVWCVRLGDDSDITPVISEEGGVPYIYVGTEVDNQGGQTGKYSGASYIYKVNGLNGSIVWQTSQPCYTYNGETSDTDQSGGCFGNPVVGKFSVSNLVIFSFSMTKDLAAGNKLVAYDKDKGTMVWEYNMNIYSYSSPVDIYDEDGNAYIVIGDNFGQIHLVNALTGERITYLKITSEGETKKDLSFEASPIVYGDTIVIGSTSGSVFGIKIS